MQVRNVSRETFVRRYDFLLARVEFFCYVSRYYTKCMWDHILVCDNKGGRRIACGWPTHNMRRISEGVNKCQSKRRKNQNT